MAATEADRDAYRRIRARGLHPRQVEGCAEIEATATRDSLTWGHLFTPEQMVEAKEAMGLAQEIEWPPLRSN